jgi:hypothetical protein
MGKIRVDVHWPVNQKMKLSQNLWELHFHIFRLLLRFGQPELQALLN